MAVRCTAHVYGWSYRRGHDYQHIKLPDHQHGQSGRETAVRSLAGPEGQWLRAILPGPDCSKCAAAQFWWGCLARWAVHEFSGSQLFRAGRPDEPRARNNRKYGIQSARPAWALTHGL